MGKSNYRPYREFKDENGNPTGFDLSPHKSKLRATFKPSGQKTNYPHTSVELDMDGNIVDYHHSESPKGQKFGLTQLVSGAVNVARELGRSTSSYDPVADKESDINDRGIDI